MNSAQNWGIIGGGILGMTLAWDLARLGHRISLFEAGNQAGGLASAWTLGDIVWDRHYHVTLLSDVALRGLLSELDLDRYMRWNETRTGFYFNGRLHPFSGAIDFVRFPLLNPVEKIRFGAAILRASRMKSPAGLEDLTVEEWLTQLSGNRVFEKMWRPLLRAKLGDDYQTTAASFMWATIQRLYAARRSGLRKELFGYLPGGYARMLETFACALRRAGVCIHLGAAVREVSAAPGGAVEIALSDGRVERFDRAVITVAAPLAARMCPRLSQRELELLARVEYLGVVCASLLLRRPLSDYYVTNIADNLIPLTGVIEMSALADREMFKGRSLVYLPRYVRPDDPAFGKPDAELEAEFLTALRRIHPALRDEEILACRISRSRYVFPRPVAGSSRQLPPVDTSISGVHILNSTHIKDGTLNVNETAQLAREQARRLHELATTERAA